MLLRGPSEKVLISRFVEQKSKNEIAMFRLSDAEICNAKTSHHRFRSYEKRQVSKKKKRKNLAVLAKTPRLNRFF